MSEEDYNALAWQTHQGNLVPCTVCGRTFSATALARHQNACKPGGLFDKGGHHHNGATSQNKTDGVAAKESDKVVDAFANFNEDSQPPASTRKPVKTSNMVLCPYCGREYGSKSLPIHVKVCQTKHHDVKVTPETIERVLTGKMSKEEVPFSLSICALQSAYDINSTMRWRLKITNPT